MIFPGVMDEEARSAHPHVAHTHIHGRRKVRRQSSGVIGRLEPENRIRPGEGCRHLRVPGQH